MEIVQVTCIAMHSDNMFWKITKPNETKLDIHIGFCPLYLVSLLMYIHIIPKIWGLVFKARVLDLMAKEAMNHIGFEWHDTLIYIYASIICSLDLLKVHSFKWFICMYGCMYVCNSNYIIIYFIKKT